MTSKRELEEDNERLRDRLEEAYDVIGDALGFEDDGDERDNQDDDSKRNVSDDSDEED